MTTPAAQPPRPRAMAPKCTGYTANGCQQDAVVANAYCISDNDQPLPDVEHCHNRWCADCEVRARRHPVGDCVVIYDRYEPLLLAYVDSPEWTMLELWMHTMHALLYEPSDHRPKRREVKKHWHVWFDVGGGVSRCPCGEEDVTFAVQARASRALAWRKAEAP